MAKASGVRTIRTPKKREKFLAVLRASCNVSKACRLSQIGRASAYEWRDADPKFAQEWEKAIEMGADLLEEEAMRRAVQGAKKPVYQGGRLVGYVREYSDTLLIFLLKGAKPQKYAGRADQKHSGRMTLEQLVCGE